MHRPEKDRPDPTPRIVHPVTGELVPDPARRLPYYEYVGARQAEWPRADFIVGNPPYVGNKRMRSALGDGYVDAIRRTYTELPDGIDLVMYWWWRAAKSVAQQAGTRAGLITTNSITQASNNPVVQAAHAAGAIVSWAIADHPWLDESEGADVRVALTVVTRANGLPATLVRVSDSGAIASTTVVARLNADLSAHADVVTAAGTALVANAGLASVGFDPQASGFIIDADEAARLLADSSMRSVIRQYMNGRDLADRPRGKWIIDFALMTEQRAREYATAFQVVRDRVYPERQSNKRASYRNNWWRFGEARTALRSALAGLPQFIGSTRVSKHRFFVMLDANVAPDGKVVCVASDDFFILGLLSSTIHVQWALAAGSRLGVGNDPTYNHTACFNPFPFPDAPTSAREEIAGIARRLDAHRRSAIARDERVTMTGMYNVVEKLRANEPLTPKERTIHEIAACGVLRDLHDELDAKVAEAYGWPWPMPKEEILERLVALHDERVEEEKRGVIRWLRPDYQIPRFAPQGAAAATDAAPDAAEVEPPPAPAESRPAWPATAVEQLAAIGALLAARPLTAAQVAAAFTGARRDLVERHLETLALMGEVVADAEGRFGVARKAA